MPKTAQQIRDEADRMFGKGASKEKFEWRRSQQAAAGLEQERKTRGGVAGAYDRNKKLVSAAATAAGYLVGGPTGAGLARGAVQGLDRPGEGGIGFDVRRGAKGFAEGYGAGSVANMGKAGLQRLFTPGGAGAGAGAPVPTPGNVPGPAPGQTMATGGYGQPVGTPGAGAGSLVGGGSGGAAGGGSFMGRVGALATNPQVLAGVAGGVADVMGQRSQQRIEEQRMAQQASQFQQQFDVNEEERKRQQEQANRLAGLFMPRAQG
jgi:hypothetical protein